MAVRNLPQPGGFEGFGLHSQDKRPPRPPYRAPLR